MKKIILLALTALMMVGCNPDLVNNLNNWDIILLGLGFAICKELVIWGLKE